MEKIGQNHWTFNAFGFTVHVKSQAEKDYVAKHYDRIKDELNRMILQISKKPLAQIEHCETHLILPSTKREMCFFFDREYLESKKCLSFQAWQGYVISENEYDRHNISLSEFMDFFENSWRIENRIYNDVKQQIKQKEQELVETSQDHVTIKYSSDKNKRNSYN